MLWNKKERVSFVELLVISKFRIISSSRILDGSSTAEVSSIACLDFIELDTFKSNLLIKHNDTFGHLKPCKRRIEGALESMKGRKQGTPCMLSS